MLTLTNNSLSTNDYYIIITLTVKILFTLIYRSNDYFKKTCSGRIMKDLFDMKLKRFLLLIGHNKGSDKPYSDQTKNIYCYNFTHR